MRILVIRRDNIGDLVCTTPLLAALRARYPDAHLAALVNSYNAGVLAGNPDLDAVHAYTKLKHRAGGESWLGTLLARLRMVSALRGQSFDHVILAKSGFDRHGLALARRVRPRNIIGFAAGEAIDGELHEVQVVMKLAERLGVSAPPGPLRVFPSPAEVERWRERFPVNKKRWIALHISAREPGRIWPAERFVELARRLARDGGVGIVLLWAPGPADDPRHPGDDARAATIATQVGSEVVLVPAKTATLQELVAILSLCDGFIGADGGALHIAAASRLPIVALFENNAYKKRHWYPWQVPYEMVSPETREIADIPVADVADAWKRLSARLERAPV